MPDPRTDTPFDKKAARAFLFMESKDQFTIHECEELAKDLNAHDTMTFDLVGPTGRLKARWLDAYFGFIQIEGQSGFLRSNDVKYLTGIYCKNLSTGEAA